MCTIRDITMTFEYVIYTYIHIYLIRNVHTSYYYTLSMYIVVKRTMKYSKRNLFRGRNMLNNKKKKSTRNKDPPSVTIK